MPEVGGTDGQFTRCPRGAELPRGTALAAAGPDRQVAQVARRHRHDDTAACAAAAAAVIQRVVESRLAVGAQDGTTGRDQRPGAKHDQSATRGAAARLALLGGRRAIDAAVAVVARAGTAAAAEDELRERRCDRCAEAAVVEDGAPGEAAAAAGAAVAPAAAAGVLVVAAGVAVGRAAARVRRRAARHGTIRVAVVGLLGVDVVIRRGADCGAAGVAAVGVEDPARGSGPAFALAPVGRDRAGVAVVGVGRGTATVQLPAGRHRGNPDRRRSRPRPRSPSACPPRRSREHRPCRGRSARPCW